MPIKYVELYRTTRDFDQVLDCVVYFDESTNQLTIVGGSERTHDTWNKMGVISRKGRVWPKDGFDFLQGLSDDYNGTYYRSTDIMETDKIPWSKKDGSKEKK